MTVSVLNQKTHCFVNEVLMVTNGNHLNKEVFLFRFTVRNIFHEKKHRNVDTLKHE